MRRNPTLWVCVLLALQAFSPANRAFAQERSIADFENPAQDTLFTIGGGAKCAMSAKLASHGKRSLRMVFERYEQGRAQWPSCGIELDALAAPRDWRRFDELLIDLHVESDDDVLVKMVLTSDPDGRWVGPRKIKPGTWTTIRLPLWLAAESGLRLEAVQSVTLVLTRPPHPAVIHMDNVRVHALGLPDPRSVEWFLTSPSFHQGFFHTKPENRVAVRWTFRTATEALRHATLRFSLEREDGVEIASQELTADTPAGTGEASFPRPEMKDNETLVVKMAAMLGGKALWTKLLKVKQYPRGRREITLRDDGVTLVDGAPFFPLGMYSSPQGELKALKRMGFNAAHSYSPVRAAYMKAAEEAEMFVVPRFKGKTKRGQHIFHDPDLDREAALKCIDELKDSPALLGYYLFDEPNPGDCPRAKLLKLCDLVRTEDPYHLAAGCNNSFQTAFYGVSDAMMVDNYPIPGPMDGLIRDMLDGAAAQAPHSALWFVPQAYNYETHFTTTLQRGPHGFRRTPTFDEIRTMPWLSITLGARGLFYYSFQTQGFYLRNAFPWFWWGFEHHIREVVVLQRWLTERAAARPPSCGNDKIHVAAFQRGKNMFVVAVNADLGETEAVVTIPGLAGRELHVISERRIVHPADDTFHETFAALETHLYVTSLEPGMDTLPMLGAIRSEVERMEAEFWSANPSLFTYRDGARLHASWGFPDPEKIRRKIWYRVIDGYPGTQWVVGNKYSKAKVPGWSKKDFKSPGRWIEVRGSKPIEFNRIRAIVTPGIVFDIQIPEGAGWRTVEGETRPDSPPRHHHYASATTTAEFEPMVSDRFRIVFPKLREKKEVVFELSAWQQ